MEVFWRGGIDMPSSHNVFQRSYECLFGIYPVCLEVVHSTKSTTIKNLRPPTKEEGCLKLKSILISNPKSGEL